MNGLKSTGIVRAVDSLGRIVIPKEIVVTMEYTKKQPLEITIEDNEYIVLSKAKDIGIVRTIDELNRVVIPKEIRDRLGVESKTPLEIFISEDVVVLRRYREMCCVCGSGEELYYINSKKICASCIDFVKNNL